jgi:hypothetical protein
MSKLTTNDVMALGEIVEAAVRGAKVARVMPEGHYAAGDIIHGIARSIGDSNGFFLTNADDIRDGFLRVTTRGGTEVFWPVRDLMEENKQGAFARYDW